MDDSIIETPKFICDVHLGKLARWLRLLGFDTIYRNDLQDKEIIDTAREDQRIVLTKDKGVLENGSVKAFQPDSSLTDGQIQQLLFVFNLNQYIYPFSRCMECNGEVYLVEKEHVKNQVPVKILEIINHFYQCQRCGKIYWRGSHYERMKRWLNKIITL
ncbi:MAG TPA: Mut7-C RNAse domain-containing protein [Syntrophales bacterium]|jgi:hypothetical protein|nr:Mut7-C RNAse domain-containing protein [Syntrophales bacterium]